MKYIVNKAHTVVLPYEPGMIEWLLENYPRSEYRVVDVEVTHD